MSTAHQVMVDNLVEKHEAYTKRLKEHGAKIFGAGLEPDANDLIEFTRLALCMEAAARAAYMVAEKYGIEIVPKLPHWEPHGRSQAVN